MLVLSLGLIKAGCDSWVIFRTSLRKTSQEQPCALLPHQAIRCELELARCDGKWVFPHCE